jgi:hypothetical protein
MTYYILNSLLAGPFFPNASQAALVSARRQVSETRVEESRRLRAAVGRLADA